jgi:hypothetical protein
MTKGRLFTFGCSLTNYYWPTWADILGYDRDHQNWGLPGLGNVGIFLHVIEAGYRCNIGPEDEVVIMWTYLGREDRYVKDKWITPGNPIEEYGENWVVKYSCEKGSMIKELACMASLIHVLNDWGCSYKFLSIELSEVPDYLKKNNITDEIIKIYSNVFEVLSKPSLYKFFLEKYGQKIPPVKLKYKDNHPTPASFLEFVKAVFPEKTISDDCIKWISEWEESVIESTNKKDLGKLKTVLRF